MVEHHCRICGLYTDTPPWGEDGNCPTYEYCFCCNVEFGYQDYTIKSTKEYRDKWLENGSKWFNEKFKPNDWNLKKQLEDIPKEYKLPRNQCNLSF